MVYSMINAQGMVSYHMVPSIVLGLWLIIIINAIFILSSINLELD